MQQNHPREEYAREMLEKHEQAVLNMCFVYLKNIHDAQDEAQEVFVKLMRNKMSFHDQAHERAWLLRVAINQCKNALRSKRVIPMNLQSLSLESPSQSDLDFFEMLLTLEPINASILHLYYYEGYSTQEIAHMLKISSANVRMRLTRARRNLKDMLEGE